MCGYFVLELGKCAEVIGGEGCYYFKMFIKLINNTRHGFLREKQCLEHSIHSKEFTYLHVCLISETANMLLT